MVNQLLDKTMLRYLFCASLLLLTCKYDSHKPILISFNGEKWLFPITVGDAAKRYNLSYKPPGYYYTEDRNGNTVNLEYTNQTGDFDNEHQAKEALYGREVHSYVHTFRFQPERIDSFRHALENQFSKKMVMYSDTQRFGLSRLTTSIQNSLPESGIVTYGLMQVDSLVVIGLRKRPTLMKSDIKRIEVLIFYNRLEDQIEKRMISY